MVDAPTWCLDTSLWLVHPLGSRVVSKCTLYDWCTNKVIGCINTADASTGCHGVLNIASLVPLVARIH